MTGWNTSIPDFLGSKVFWRFVFFGWFAYLLGWGLMYAAFNEYMTEVHGPFWQFKWVGSEMQRGDN